MFFGVSCLLRSKELRLKNEGDCCITLFAVSVMLTKREEGSRAKFFKAFLDLDRPLGYAPPTCNLRIHGYPQVKC